MRSLKLRPTNADDVSSIIDFYERHWGKQVERRNPEILRIHIERGDCIVIIADDDCVIGASMSYSLLKGVYAEIGSTLISGLRPLNPLYELLVTCQAVHKFFTDPPDRWMVGNVDIDRPRLRERVVTGLYAEPFDPDDALVAANAATGAVHAKPVIWYRLTPLVVPLLVRKLALLRAGGHLLLCNGRRRIAFDVEEISLARCAHDFPSDIYHRYATDHDYGWRMLCADLLRL